MLDYIAVEAADPVQLRALATGLAVGAADAGDDAPATLHDRTGDCEQAYGVIELSASLSEAFERLPARERRALDLRLRYSLKQSEIAALMGCSQMQVSRILRRAAERLREQMAI